MVSTTKHGLRFAAALTAAAFVACAKGEQASGSADSTARNLTLAPTESTAAMKDVPAPQPQPAKPAPKRTAPKAEAPKHTAPPAPTTLTAPAGTAVALTATDTISTRHVKAGQAFTATVGSDVTDAAGHVVIPAGSTVEGTIDEARPRPNPHSPGRLELSVHSVTVRGVSYPVEGAVVSMDTVEQGRGVTTADVAKVGAGAAAGAIVGKIIGKNATGAVVGGVAGAATGAAIARASRDIDIVLPKGAAFTLKLTGPVTVKRAM